MPNAVVHVLFTIIVIDLFRDHVLKDKRSLPLHYVFLGGFAGLLPDIDIPFFWLVKHILGFEVPWLHRLFTHSLLFVLVFLIPALFLWNLKKSWSKIMFIFAFGVAFHIFLDWLFTGGVMPFYPISHQVYGPNIFGLIGFEDIAQGMEAIVLLWWLWHEERTHKISDFI